MITTWVRLDDSFPEHPKIAELSLRAFRAHVEGLCYANRNLTDGVLPSRVALAWGKSAAQELARAGVWEKTDAGYSIHDYHEYQPTKAEIQEKRDAAKERMARVRANRRSSSPEVLPAPKPVPEPKKQPHPSAFGGEEDFRPAPGLTQMQEELIHGLREFDPVWEKLTYGGINKLNARFGHGLLLEVLRRAREGKQRPVDPYSWCLVVGQTIAAKEPA